MRKVQQIDGLKIDEISLVDKGANQHATVTIAKSADGEKEQQMDLFDEQGNPLDPETLSHGDVVYGEDGQAYLFELDEAEGENAEVEDELEKELEPVGKSFENPFRRHQPQTVSKSTDRGLADELREELSKALTDRDRDDVVSKALQHMGRLEEIAKAAQRAAEAERHARLETEFTEIAKSYNLPIRDDVLGGVLMRCAERLPEEDCEIIAKCLQAAGEALFEETGSIGGGSNSDVLSAAEMAIAKSADGADKAEAMVEYFSNHPEAYDELLAERG